MSQPQLQPARSKPRLLFFRSATSGHCRLVEGYLAHVLTAGRNHTTFEVTHIDVNRNPAFADQLGVTEVPAILLVEEGRLIGRLDNLRGTRQIRDFLQPWLNKV
jgi:thioredoxin-like negative regulator of GroEL